MVNCIWPSLTCHRHRVESGRCQYCAQPQPNPTLSNGHNISRWPSITNMLSLISDPRLNIRVWFWCECESCTYSRKYLNVSICAELFPINQVFWSVKIVISQFLFARLADQYEKEAYKFFANFWEYKQRDFKRICRLSSLSLKIIRFNLQR